MVAGDEVEQVFVDPQSHGTGVAAPLLAAAEQQVAAAGTTSPGSPSSSATPGPARSTRSTAGTTRATCPTRSAPAVRRTSRPAAATRRRSVLPEPLAEVGDPGQVTSRSRRASTHCPSTAGPPWICQSSPHRASASACEVCPAARHSGSSERQVADDGAPQRAAWSRRRPRSPRRRTRGPRPAPRRRWPRGRRSTRSRARARRPSRRSGWRGRRRAWWRRWRAPAGSRCWRARRASVAASNGPAVAVLGHGRGVGLADDGVRRGEEVSSPDPVDLRRPGTGWR